LSLSNKTIATIYSLSLPVNDTSAAVEFTLFSYPFYSVPILLKILIKQYRRADCYILWWRL